MSSVEKAHGKQLTGNVRLTFLFIFLQTEVEIRRSLLLSPPSELMFEVNNGFFCFLPELMMTKFLAPGSEPEGLVFEISDVIGRKRPALLLNRVGENTK